MAPSSFSYTEVPLKDCLSLGTRLIQEGHHVHFHVLSPDCKFNPDPDRYAFLIENNSEDITYLAFSESFPEVDKDLTKLQFGDSILDEASSRLAETGFVEHSIVLRRILDLQKEGRTWHHHMHFPRCVLNPQKGRWTISVEANGQPEKSTVEAYEERPTDILREIEILYFRNLEKQDDC
jgi:hypothetical protein